MGKWIFSLILLYHLGFMAKELRPEIRDNYKLYKSLLNEKKYIKQTPITLKKIKKSNINYFEEDTDIKHHSLLHSISLLSTAKIINPKYFGFNLRCIFLSEKPFFGYHSQGAAHRNYDENIPFAEQQVETPHFNYYNGDGIKMAYKTDKLKDQNECKALEDISLCGIYFCQESNTSLDNGEFPDIVIDHGRVLFKYIDEDPNTNVKFR
jgi:hypothetical protein